MLKEPTEVGRGHLLAEPPKKRCDETLFVDQYLALLREFKKWNKLKEPTEVGDLCLLAEPNQKRRNWPLCVVDSVVSNAQDGLVRSVRLRMADKYVTRSVRSLIFLRHLEDYDPGEVAGPGYGPDKPDPPRDSLMRFIRDNVSDKEDVTVAACLLTQWEAAGEQSSAMGGR